ncbi:cob(I)yrinic acid a,c-diamide adenosyltransferase [Candidatus Neomarinimicrobiota bacterium]
MRITKVTTKTGDKGKTKLSDGSSISKSDIRIKAIGSIDELNSHIGAMIVMLDDSNICSDFNQIQNALFNLGGELSDPNNKIKLLEENAVTLLSNQISTLNKDLPPLKEFILPGGDELTSAIHISRAICRRTECKVVELVEKESGGDLWIKYLNRLSDYLFVIARYLCHKREVKEVHWKRSN